MKITLNGHSSTYARGNSLSRAIAGLAMLGTSVISTGCLPDAPSKPTAVADMAMAPDAPQNLTAKQMFNLQVLPLLQTTCGACHSREIGVGPGFLRSASADPNVYDPYPIVIAWNNFIVSDPELSALITKGQHEGPALTMSQYDATLAWLQQEKKERDAVTVTPFKPQVPPFAITITPSGQPTVYNNINLDQINPIFVGAYIRFVAKTLNTNGNGLEISDLRLINTKANPQPGEQRSIHYKSPLFILWRGGTALPDPANSFAGVDRTVALNQNDAMPVGSLGALIVPGILVLDEYRPGYSLSVLFDTLELVKPVPGSNPCSAAQLNVFKTSIAYPFLGATSGGVAVACAQAKCHDNLTSVSSLDMTPTLSMTSDLSTLCELMRFYNNVPSIMADNTDPASTVNHPFKWTPTNCAKPAPPLNSTCINDFKTALDTWRATQ